VTISVASGYEPLSATFFTGTAAQVQSFLDSFAAKTAHNGPGQIAASFTDGSSSSSGTGGGKVLATLTFNGTARGGSGLQSPTTAQIGTLSNDTMTFYNDQKSAASTSGDVTQLTNDLSGLVLSKSDLAQLLTAALQGDAGADAGTLGSDLANVFYGAINGDTHSQSSNLGADLTSMIKKAVAVGGTYAGLAATESAATALAQMVSQYHLTS
jgi:hypothetical protein